MSIRKESKGFLFGVLAGGIVGSITALLLAPKAGKELRQDISDQAQKARETTIKAVDQARETTGRIAKQIGGQAVQIAGITKQAAGTVASGVKGLRKSTENVDATNFIAADAEQSVSEIEAVEAVEAGETEAAVTKEF